jgi:hypothetical protein
MFSRRLLTYEKFTYSHGPSSPVKRQRGADSPREGRLLPSGAEPLRDTKTPIPVCVRPLPRLSDVPKLEQWDPMDIVETPEPSPVKLNTPDEPCELPDEPCELPDEPPPVIPHWLPEDITTSLPLLRSSWREHLPVIELQTGSLHNALALGTVRSLDELMDRASEAPLVFRMIFGSIPPFPLRTPADTLFSYRKAQSALRRYYRLTIAPLIDPLC